MLNVSYYFYYHLNDNFPKEEVISCIKNKDFDGFIKLYKKWGKFYLPQNAFVTAGEDYEHVVSTDVTNKLNFLEITDYEYECG